jgi:hypothetical protein
MRSSQIGKLCGTVRNLALGAAASAIHLLVVARAWSHCHRSRSMALAVLPLLVMIAVAGGCRQTTTERIIGTDFFADFEAQLNAHDLGIRPVPKHNVLCMSTTVPSTQPTGRLAPYFAEKDKPKPDPAVLKALRNEIVNGLIAVDEQDFQAYTGDIGHVQRTSSVISDITVLALTTTATVTGGAEAKSVLAGLAAIFTGSRIAADKEIFFQNTFPALVFQMQFKREQQRAAIQQKLSTTEDADYPVSAAFIDVLVLYRYGTITGAIASISQPPVVLTFKGPSATDAKALDDALTNKTVTADGVVFTISAATWDTGTNQMTLTLTPPATAPKTPIANADVVSAARIIAQGTSVGTSAQTAALLPTFTIVIGNMSDLKDYVQPSTTQPATVPAAGPGTPAPTPAVGGDGVSPKSKQS